MMKCYTYLGVNQMKLLFSIFYILLFYWKIKSQQKYRAIIMDRIELEQCNQISIIGDA